MRTILALFCGLICLSCLFYMFLVTRVLIYSDVSTRGQISSTWFMEFLRNTTATGQDFGSRKSPSPTKPSITGAIRHYTSLSNKQSLTLQCSSCALVSSSGFLLGQQAGKDIDQHSCVIRLNIAPVEGYEQDVGSRTTLRIMNFFLIGVKPDKLPPNSTLMTWGLFRRTKHLKHAMNLTQQLSNGSMIYGQSLRGEREAEALFAKETGQSAVATKSWISTGWFALMIAADLCQTVHVYGMVPADYCMSKNKEDVPYHYYELPRIKECSTYNISEKEKKGGHRFITEKAVFARWSLRYNITFHHPSWNVDSSVLSKQLDTPFIGKQGWLDWLWPQKTSR